MSESLVTTLGDDRLATLVPLIQGADSVELKLSVPDADSSSTVRNLGMDVLEAQIRQVFYFDTRDLDLERAGVVVRARRVQGKQGDTVVKRRPVVPADLPVDLRATAGFGVEVDAMPGGFVCSASLKAEADNDTIKAAVAGDHAVRKLFSKGQRAFYAAHAPSDLTLDDLAILGPVPVLKLKFRPDGYDRRMVAELWTYPDGSRILELSTKCGPTEAFEVAARTRVFLSERGVDLAGEQRTKTRAALEYFARNATVGVAAGEGAT